MTGDTRRRPKLSTLIRVALGLGLIFWLVSRLDLDAVGNVVRQTSWFHLLAGTTLLCASQVAAALSWYCGLRLLLHGSDQQCPSPGETVRLFWESLLFAVISPGAVGGDAFRIFSLRRHGIRPLAAIAAGVNQRANSLAAAVTVAAFLTWAFVDQSAMRWLRAVALGTSLVVPITVIPFVLVGARGFFPVRQGGRAKFELFAFASAALAHLGTAIGVAIAGYPVVETISFAELTAIAALAKLVGILGIIPAGLGVVEAATVYLTSLVGGTLAHGGAFAVIQRLLVALMYVVIGATVVIGGGAEPPPIEEVPAGTLAGAGQAQQVDSPSRP